MGKRISKICMALIIIFSITLALFGCGGGGGGSGSSADVNNTMTLIAEAKTPSEVSINWTEHDELIIGYDLVRNGKSVFDRLVKYGPEYNDRNLNSDTRYCYRVYAVSVLGVEGKSNKACVTTDKPAKWNIETISNGWSPSLTLDASNKPHVGYRDLKEKYSVFLARKNTDGWLYSAVDDDVGWHGDTDIQVDIYGADQISYSNVENNQLMHASNTTGVIVTESAATNAGSINALTVDNDGYTHMVYDAIVPYTLELKYVSNVSGSWQSERVVGYSSSSLRDADILLDSGNVVHAAIASCSIECYVHYISNEDGVWRDQIISDEGNSGVSIAIDSMGDIHLVYSKIRSIEHAQYTGGSWKTELIDTFSWVGGQRVGLAIDNADHLHVAYQDQNQDLKYATNKNGLWEHHYLDTSGDVGSDPSITISPIGKISIVYMDETNNTIKYATSP